MAATTNPQCDPASGPDPDTRCSSAEAAVMRWALSHIAARRLAAAEASEAEEGAANGAR